MSSAKVRNDTIVPLGVAERALDDVPRPIVLGVPLPQGMARPEDAWFITQKGDVGFKVRAQTKVLLSWPDQSVKWLSAILPPKREILHGPIELHSAQEADLDSELSQENVSLQEYDEFFEVSTGHRTFRVEKRGTRFLANVEYLGRAMLAENGCQLFTTNRYGRRTASRITRMEVSESGPVRAKLLFGGAVGNQTDLAFSGSICFFVNSGLVRLELTVQNPRRAKHPDGYWDLGDPGSIFLDDLSLQLSTSASQGRQVSWTEALTDPPKTSLADRWELYQDSSGGSNWQNRNHVNHAGRIPIRFQGYRLLAEGHGIVR